MTKLTDAIIEEIKLSLLPKKEIAKLYEIAISTVSTIKRGKYRSKRMYKLFGTKTEIGKVIAEEYVKVFGKEPERVSVMVFAEFAQFLVLPENIMWQLPKYALTNESRFRNIAKHNMLYKFNEKT